jgi:hypothetical protein
MTRITARQCWSWSLSALVAISLAVTTACAGKPASARYTASSVGSNCYAKALPTVGEGGLAWGDTLSMARKKSMDNCIRYAGRSGGTPDSCQVVLAQCKN